METPIDALVADMVNKLDAGLREDFEERAAIMEYDGKLPRAHAECLALLNVLQRHPGVLTGLTVLQLHRNGAGQYLLTTDLPLARQRLAQVGSVELGVRDLAEVVDEEYGGIAVLATIEFAPL